MNHRWVFLTLCWLALVVGGSAVLLIHSQTPGEAGGPPERWPAASGIARGSQRPTLVMFAHPKCPCTRASMEELAELMARSQGLVDARVVFFKPEEAGENWALTDTWKSAAAIPGVTVQTDIDGREAALFQAATSGQVVLYDARGQLLFQGGITEARGHAGDNEGLAAILDLLQHGKTPLSTSPVYGCPIQDKKSASVAAKQP